MNLHFNTETFNNRFIENRLTNIKYHPILTVVSWSVVAYLASVRNV